MNYYNPYFFNMPTSATTLATPRVGLLTRLFGRTGVTISNILDGTQRVLSFANQAIPIVKQVKPIIGNAKTMFRVMNEFKKSEKPTQILSSLNTNNNTLSKEETSNNDDNKYINNNGPTFFI